MRQRAWNKGVPVEVRLHTWPGAGQRAALHDGQQEIVEKWREPAADRQRAEASVQTALPHVVGGQAVQAAKAVAHDGHKGVAGRDGAQNRELGAVVVDESVDQAIDFNEGAGHIT